MRSRCWASVFPATNVVQIPGVQNRFQRREKIGTAFG
jgi:hypothetical protein